MTPYEAVTQFKAMLQPPTPGQMPMAPLTIETVRYIVNQCDMSQPVVKAEDVKRLIDTARDYVDTLDNVVSRVNYSDGAISNLHAKRGYVENFLDRIDPKPPTLDEALQVLRDLVDGKPNVSCVDSISKAQKLLNRVKD